MSALVRLPPSPLDSVLTWRRTPSAGMRSEAANALARTSIRLDRSRVWLRMAFSSRSRRTCAYSCAKEKRRRRMGWVRFAATRTLNRVSSRAAEMAGKPRQNCGNPGSYLATCPWSPILS